jgi:hypothetical protein
VIESRVRRVVVIKATHPSTPGDFCPEGLGLGFASGDANPTLFGTTDTCLALVALGDVSNHDIMCLSREDEPRSSRKT